MVDASPYGAGAVLQQEDINGKRYVCRYECKSFSDRERRYPQIMRTLLGSQNLVADAISRDPQFENKNSEHLIENNKVSTGFEKGE
ncbi:hypothetical protein AYI69_g4688 [Smittium culicis]|uniref:Reverse transcriptase/retrotransposon-derived protein RNase H-like domain-containing protein n=1 Tax=Smittium culicis TaxID=133412 RepID=A0A1R1YBH2_9FUNG|nr:hypothetical protein AYI69_g4688 [Smittium culicis]